MVGYSALSIARLHMATVLYSRQEVVNTQPQRLTLLLTPKRLLPTRPLKIPHSRIRRLHSLPASTRLNLRSRIDVPSHVQVRDIRIRVMGAGKADPVVHDGLRERRVIGVSFGQAEASPGAEDLRQVAGVAFEVLAFWVSVCMGGGFGGVAEGLCGS